MRRAIFAVLTAVFMGSGVNIAVAADRSAGLYQVAGVEEGEMLKMRAGPGTGYKIVLGLPNGTVLRVHECDQTGGTRWCKASLKQARRLIGYVSSAYLNEI